MSLRKTICFAAILLTTPLFAVFSQDPPLGLKPVKVPQDNPMTEAKVELGKQLYFDTRLSKDNTVSCASCHDPDKGWSNDAAVAHWQGDCGIFSVAPEGPHARIDVGRGADAPDAPVVPEERRHGREALSDEAGGVDG